MVALLAGMLAACTPQADVGQPLAVSAVSVGGSLRERHFIQVEKRAYLASQLFESSGLASVDGQLWTLNDSGDGPWLYQLDSGGGVARRVRLEGARNIDWESLASDRRWLYVADCGNNSGKRKRFQLYRVALAQLGTAADGASIESQTLEFSFADPAPVAGVHNHDNDCEAIAAVDGKIWLLTKGWASQTSRLYILDPGLEYQVVSAAAELPVRGLVTGVDYSASRRELAILGYTKGALLSEGFIWRVPLGGAGVDWSAAQHYSLWPSGQWEGIVWHGDRLLLTREQSPLGDAWLGEVTLDAAR